MFVEKLKYMEDVNSAASNIHDCIEEKLKEFAITKLTTEQSDKIWDALQDVLTDFSEIAVYRQHN